MAHTLSSQQSYAQCSPSTSVYGTFQRAHTAVTMHSGFQSSGKPRLSDFRGKSWTSFGDALASESSTDDDTDTEAEDPLAMPTITTTIAGSPAAAATARHNRGSVVRLKRRDYNLYGYRPETDPFAVVTCRHCRKVLKSSALRRHIDLRHEPMVKLDRIDKISGAVEKISVEHAKGEKRHRHAVRKSLEAPPPAVAAISAPQPQPQPPPPPPPPPLVTAAVAAAPQQQQHQQHPPPPLSESSSASNSPQPRRKKRKQVLEPLAAVETFQAATTAAPPTTCRIIMSSSPPPLAPITNESTAPPPPSVWIVTPSPAVIIDGSFVVKPLESELDTELDLKDLKVLKPAAKETPSETATTLSASNWYAQQPRPLALNTFNMRKINAQRYVMATQRKLIELGRTLRQDEKIGNAVVKPQPKTWSFIERSQVFIPFRVTH